VPYSAAKLCSRPWCNKLNCNHQKADHRRGSTARGYDSLWQRLSKIVLIEEPYCRICEREGRRARTTMVDHIVPTVHGGTSNRLNLQGVCTSCNTRKGNLLPGDHGWKESFWPSPGVIDELTARALEREIAARRRRGWR